MLIFFYKIENNFLAGYLTKLIIKYQDVHSYQTRQTEHYKMIKKETVGTMKSIFYKG